MNFRTRYFLPIALMSTIACNDPAASEKTVASGDSTTNNSYAADRKFLEEHSGGLLELISADGKSKVLLSADYQGRVMTSSANGDEGRSFGWLNYKLIQAPQKKAQFNPVGGEERFWLGPEGGQYSFYFKQGDSFNIAHWQVPTIIDTVNYKVVHSNNTEAIFTAKTILKNYSGEVFNIDIVRKVSLVKKADLATQLGVSIDSSIRCVAYETNNTICNTGTTDWTTETGLPSIWLLGMFTPTPKTVVIIPFEKSPDSGKYITDDYFGKIPAERLQVKENLLYFTCDGKYRSKIGLSPLIAKPIAGSFDFANNVLTLIVPEVHKDSLYVNSKWELQKEPYKGDVINSYNDGPLADGSQMGPFYEIESSSPAMRLAVNQTGEYRQTTCHLQGNYQSLKTIAQQLLGVNLDEIKR
jgi:hypothetical protein